MSGAEASNPNAQIYYMAPIAGDFRQGDVFSDVLHVAVSGPGFRVLREFSARGGRTAFSIHEPENEPQGGFKWEDVEKVQADGQLRLGVVLTHDCEIENDDSRHHRLVGLLRPLDQLSEQDSSTIVEGKHIGRLYLLSWAEVGLPESYLDLRRITTVRDSALPEEQRIASMTDFGRKLLQSALVQYLTELESKEDE